MATRIDPATVSLSQRYHDQDAANYEITVTPPTATSPAMASTQPVHIIVEGREIVAPAGSAVRMISSVPASTEVESSADAAGPTLRTNGDKGNFASDAPTVELPGQTIKGASGRSVKGGGGSAAGGDSAFSWTQLVASVSAASTGQKALWGIGILLLVAAVVMLVVEHFFGGVTDWILVGILAGGGLFFIGLGIVAESHPWLLALIPIAVIGGIVYYCWKWKTKAVVVPSVPEVPNG